MHGPSHGGGSSFSGGGGGSISGGFSGGSSGGGAHFGPSGGGYRGYRGPRPIIFFGRTYYCASGAVGGALFALVAMFFAVLFLIFGANTLADSKTTIAHMEEDSVEWRQIISQAIDPSLTDDEYFTYDMELSFEGDQGIFADGYTYYGYSSDKKYGMGGELTEWAVLNYMLTYEDMDYFQMFFVFTDEQDHRVVGLTYAQFAENQIGNLHSVQIAYKWTNTEVLAINADYELSKCMDYLEAKDAVKGATTEVIVSSVIAAVFLAGIVLALVLGIKKGNREHKLAEEKAKAEIEKTNAETENIKADTEKKNRKCAYCGGDLPEDAVFCPGCGSRVSK